MSFKFKYAKIRIEDLQIKEIKPKNAIGSKKVFGLA